MMFDDSITPEEQAVIQELRNDPRPKLHSERRDAIRQQLFAEMDNVFPPPSQPQSTPITPHMGIIIAIVVIVVVIVIAILTAAATKPVPPLPPTTQPEASATLGATATLTPESTASATPAPTVASAADSLIVIEGPVQSINV